MATFTSADDAALLQLTKKLILSQGGTMGSGGVNRGALHEYKTVNSKGETSIDFSQLKNVIKNNSDLATQFGATIKDLSNKNKQIKNLYDQIEKNTRDRTKIERESAIALADYVSKQKNAVTGLQEVSKKLEDAKASMAASNKVFLDIEQMAKKRKELEDAVAAKKKSKKASSSQQRELDEFIKENAKRSAELDASANEIVESFLKLNEISKTLTDEQIKSLKNFKTMDTAQRDASGVVNTVSESMKGLHQGSSIAADNLVNNSKLAGEGLKNFGKAATIFGKALIAMIPNIYKGMLADQRYNIKSTGYGESLVRGMNEQERAQAIGENRIGLRGLGGGDEEKGFSNSKALQETAHIFGVTGADALKKAFEYQKISMSMGVSTSDIKAQQQQQAQMHSMSKAIGSTDEELQDFYATLKDNGQIASMSAAMSQKSDKERSEAINKEIFQRLALNKAMGVSIEMLKQDAQRATNAQYAGLASTIKAGLGEDVRIRQYNKDNPNAQISDADRKFMKLTDQAGGRGVLTDKADIERYNNIEQKVGTANKTKYAADQKTAANGDTTAWYKDQANQQIYGALGLDAQGKDTDAINSAQQRQAQGKDAVQTNFSDVIKDATESLNGPKGLTGAAMDAAEALEGLKKSPIGGAGGIASFIGGAIASKIGGSIAKWGAGKLATKLGAESTLGKVLGTVSEGGGSVSGSIIKTVTEKIGGSSVGAAGKGLLSKLGPGLLRGLIGGVASYAIDKELGGTSTLSKVIMIGVLKHYVAAIMLLI